MKITSMWQLFEAVTLAIYNTSTNQEVQKRMTAYGFTPKRIQEGRDLLEGAKMAQSKQEEYYDSARRISVQISDERVQVLEVFKLHVAIAKTAFMNEPHRIQELKIKKLAEGKWQRIQQAVTFYQKSSAHMEKLSAYGASAEEFAQTQASVESLLALKVERMKCKGSAEDSTQAKSEQMKALRDWYGEFRKLARIAFKNNPQQLEAFGIVVSNSKSKKTDTTAA